MRPMPRLRVSSVSALHISCAWARLSNWHGPAIRTNGLSLPISRLWIFTRRGLVITATLHQARLRHGRADKRYEQRMRLEQARLQFRMELHANEPRMIGNFHDLRQDAVRRHAGEQQPLLFQLFLVVDVHLVAMAVPLGDRGLAIDVGDRAARLQDRLVGTEAHGAAEVAAGGALLELVAAHPFGHQADHRLRAGTELRRAGVLHADQVAGRLDHRHLHAEADAEIRDLALARKARRIDLAFRATLAEAAGHQDAVNAFQVLDRVLALEDLGIDPVEIDLHVVGDA